MKRNLHIVDVLWLLPTAIMILAGIAKFADLETFVRALSTWTLVPHWARIPIAIGIPAFELGVGLATFIGLWRRHAVMALLVFLVFLTTVFAFESLISAPPDCGCFGVIALWNEAHSTALWVLIRNGFLIALLGLSCFIYPGAADEVNRSSATNGLPSVRHGFSLVELLVVIVVMATLVGLALPSLRRSMSNARETASQANLRTHAITISMYGTDNNDTLPWFTDAKTWNLTLAYGGRDYAYPHFFQTHLWPIGLASYYSGIWPHESLHYPGVQDDNSYYLSSTTLASPSFWDPAGRTGADQWKAQHLHGVTFPSQKTLLVTGPRRAVPWWYTYPRTVSYGLFDGSAGQFDATRLLDPLKTGDGRWYGAYHTRGVFGMHTKGGILGRDIR